MNADLVAPLAKINAEKLVMMTNITGVMDKEGDLLTNLTPQHIDDLVAKRHALRRHVAENQLGHRSRPPNGVKAVHIIDGRVLDAAAVGNFHR